MLCAVCYLIAAGMPTAWSFALAISLAAFFNDLVMGGGWSTCQDIGGRHTAVVAGCMNTASSAGGALAGWGSGKVLDWYLNAKASEVGVAVEALKEEAWKPERSAALMLGYETNLLMFAVITAVAALFWLGADAERPLAK